MRSLNDAGKALQVIIKMKLLLTITILFTSLVICAQPDSISLKVAMQKLDKAMMQKDETTLQILLHKDVSYGHSNGWIQSRSDVLNDFKTGKRVYNKIENTSSSLLSINKKWATVKTNTNADGAVNGTAFKLTLHVMQVWMRTKKGWQLFARQSAKQ